MTKFGFTILTILVFLLSIATACSQKTTSSTTQNGNADLIQPKHKALKNNNYPQGISGKVVELLGDHMPAPNAPNSPTSAGGKKGGVKRQIAVFPLSQVQENSNYDGFHPLNTEEMIATTFSDEDGNFKIGLPVGTYTLVVWEVDKWYANSFDGKGNINPIKVEENKFTETTLQITHRATF